MFKFKYRAGVHQKIFNVNTVIDIVVYSGRSVCYCGRATVRCDADLFCVAFSSCGWSGCDRASDSEAQVKYALLDTL